MFNCSCKICLTFSLSILTISAIIQMLKHRSFWTISLIFSTFPLVFDIEGCPGRLSSSTSSRPCMNHLCHSKTHVHDITLSPYTFFNSWKHSEFFSISEEISDLMRCSIFILVMNSAEEYNMVTLKQSSEANRLT
jgi:hypothetical protein